MNSEIKLFINGEEVEFSQDPKLLLNFKETELHNPTVVRNSFTKQIQIEGTSRNNDIFGHIWNLTRVQDGNFNPIKKTDFQLFVNGELAQRGYCKLDKVTITNNTTQYSLTLYGGLGSFFFNLTYDQDNGGNSKRTLASLRYTTEWTDEPDLDFTIDKDSVYQAWSQLAGYSTESDPKWNIINFVPALNGIPGDFDAAKILINNYNLNVSGASGFQTSKTVDGVTYRPVLGGVTNASGYSLAEVPTDLQEWQTRDLRCYNQRPAISMRAIIDACCQPENNGGYQVKLDNHFFNTFNPYYFDSWVTLGMLRDMEGMGGGETYDITGATISSTPSSQYGNYMYLVNADSATLAGLNNVNMDISVGFQPTGSTTTTAETLYSYHTFSSKGTTIQPGTFVKDMEINQGVMVQLFALGSTGEVVGQSKAYLLAGKKNWNEKDTEPMWEYFYNYRTNEYGVEPTYEYLEGYFRLIDGKYVWCDMNGNEQRINVKFAPPTTFSNLMVKISNPMGLRAKFLLGGSQREKHENQTPPGLYTTKSTSTTGRHTLAAARLQDRINGNFTFTIESFQGLATDYESLFSGTRITKDRLLTTKNTPCDYLLSYCKLFGLYFYYDSAEESDDPERYPSGVVHIMDRNTFYTDEVVDLSKLIDWDKKIEITPALADTKWYKFDTEHVDSELENGYKQQFGVEYGAQVVNTSFNFNADTTNLYDGNVFKSGIMALEKDKYYKKTDSGFPIYQYNGLKYTLYARTDPTDEFSTTEIEYPVTTTMYMQSINPRYEFFDSFPKLQLHAEENEAVEGDNILVFLYGSRQTDTDYWISDDTPEMATLNDGQPCWLLTRSETDAAGRSIAKRITEFPYFTRDMTFGGAYGNIIHSWNFGHPQVIYSPDTYTTEGDSIYDVAWQNYIKDMYNVNTRKISCYVKVQLDGRPWPYWLRRFYWFENSIWRLNEIKDLNIGSYDTTKMEFIKVQDMENYKLEKIEYQGSNYIVMDQDTIGCSGGAITGKVYLQGAGGWYAADVLGGVDADGNRHYLDTPDVMTPTSGSGEVSVFSFNMPENNSGVPVAWTVTVVDDLDARHRTTFMQYSCDTGSTLAAYPFNRTVTARASSISFTLITQNISGLSVSCRASWARPSIHNGEVVVEYAENTGAERITDIVLTGRGVDGPMTFSIPFTQRSN